MLLPDDVTSFARAAARQPESPVQIPVPADDEARTEAVPTTAMTVTDVSVPPAAPTDPLTKREPVA